MKALSENISCNAVGNLIHFAVSIVFVLVYHSYVVGCLRHLPTEHGDDGLCGIYVGCRMVESIQQRQLLMAGHIDVADFLAGQHFHQNHIITLQMLRDHPVGIAALVILSTHRILAIHNQHLDINGFGGSAVDNSFYGNRFAVKIHIII